MPRIEPPCHRKRYAVLVTGHASPFTLQKYGDYGKMFVELLKDSDDETWEIFDVIDNHFPAQDQLLEFDGYVITGSRCDAHGDEEWILKLCEMLRVLHRNKVRMLGICFGHQVLSRALGGRTGRNPGGWDIGMKQVTLNPLINHKPYGSTLPKTIKILGTHRDQVQEIPPGAELLASSKYTKVEMYAIGNHVLGIQGHPEFRKDIILDTLGWRIESGVVPEEVGKRALHSMTTLNADIGLLSNLCKQLLKCSHA